MNKTSMSDNNKYPSICLKAYEDDTVFSKFKTYPEYVEVLEHCSFGQGQSYLDVIKNKYPFLIPSFPKFGTNDNLGSPQKFRYEYGEFSPTTFRYIKVLGELTEIFGDLNEFDIAEIGGGYGGQGKIVMDFHNPNSYTIFDLPEVLKLQEKYLSKISNNFDRFSFKNLESYTDDKTYDLVISNYAYTECSEEVRNTYFEKIIQKSKRGYLTCNFLPRNILENELIRKIYGSYFLDENPITGLNNVIVIWNNQI